MPVLSDAQVDEYLSRIGQKLAQNAGGPQFEFQFRLVNQAEINAFALPGGFIFVNRGILENAKNEGEVAGVLAHEISHVTLRHGTHQASKAYLAQAGMTILGGLLGGKIGQNTAQIIDQVGGLGMNALFLKFGRDLETQADVRGAQILAASGYSPVDMVNFFHTLEGVDKSKTTSWMSDHPAPPDRIKRIEQEAKLLKVSDAPTENVENLRQVQMHLASLGPAKSSQQVAHQTAPPSQGQPPASGGKQSFHVPAPANEMKTYNNSLYKIGYPANWEVHESEGSGVTIAPPGGAQSVNGSNDIVYGAIVNQYDPSDKSSHESETQELIGAIEQSSKHLKFVNKSGRRVRLADGSQGLAAVLRGTDPATGVDERVTILTRQMPDQRLLYMLFVTPERDAESYRNVLSSMAITLQMNNGH